MTYRFADLTLDTGLRRLERSGKPIDLGKRTYELLVALVEAAPNVLSHDEVVDCVWGGRPTSPETVTQRIKLLRDAIGDSAERPRYVGLVRGHGYRLIPPLAKDTSSAPEYAAQTENSHAASDISRPIAAQERARNWTVAAGIAAVLVLSAFVAAFFAGGPSTPQTARAAFDDFEITRLTAIGNAFHPAISADGRYVVYAQTQPGSRLPPSLWVRTVATSNRLEIVPAEPGTVIAAPTVTPDGNFVDFLRLPNDAATSSLWRVPILGGTPRPIADSVWGPVGWSPDGKHMAFVRAEPSNVSALVVAEADGGGEHVLATREPPRYFLSLQLVGNPPIRPAWSPDGSVIALFELDDLETPLVFVDVATGSETIREPGGSYLAQGVSWLGPQALILSQPAEIGQPVQLWRMSYPDGAVSRLTNDLANYIGVDADASGTEVVTGRREVRVALWVGDGRGTGGSEVVPPSPFGGTTPWLSWAGERLLFETTIDGRPAVAAITPGQNAEPQEIVRNGLQGVGTSDGSTYVFIRGNEGLWKTDASSRETRQLVSGSGLTVEPVVSPDDSVVFFVSSRSGALSPWSVPVTGGEPAKIIDGYASLAMDVSPDGERLLLGSNGTDGRPVIVVCDLPECNNPRDVALPANYGGGVGTLRWTPDGLRIAYVDALKTNIWSMSIDGDPPRQVTQFDGDTGDRIGRFAWSRDGSKLALALIQRSDQIALLRAVEH